MQIFYQKMCTGHYSSKVEELFTITLKRGNRYKRVSKFTVVNVQVRMTTCIHDIWGLAWMSPPPPQTLCLQSNILRTVAGEKYKINKFNKLLPHEWWQDWIQLRVFLHMLPPIPTHFSSLIKKRQEHFIDINIHLFFFLASVLEHCWA